MQQLISSQTLFLAIYLRKRMIKSVLWKIFLNSYSMDIIFFTFSDLVKSDMDSTWYFCRLINCESQIHLVTHWVEWFKSEIISRNLSIGNIGDALPFSTKNYQKITGTRYSGSLNTDGPWRIWVWRPLSKSTSEVQPPHNSTDFKNRSFLKNLLHCGR